MSQTEEYTMNVFLSELRERVSANNAKLLLHGAATKSGMPIKMDQPMKREEAQALCIELINSGGPCFQVGRKIYSQLQA